MGVPPFWSILEHFHDLERIFPKNTHFPVPQPGPPVVSQAGTTPLPTLASLARPSEDVFEGVGPKYVLGGPGARLARVGRGVAAAWLATGGPGLGTGKCVFLGKILSTS